MRLLQFDGVKLAIDETENLLYRTSWLVGWDEQQILSPETLRTRAVLWAGSLGAPLRVPAEQPDVEYAELAGTFVTRIEFAPSERSNHYAVLFFANAATADDAESGEPLTPGMESGGARIESVAADGDRRIECSWRLPGTKLASWLPAIGDAIEWGRENLVCIHTQTEELASGRCKVKIVARELATRMIGAPEESFDENGVPTKTARYIMRRADYPAWAAARLPGSAAPWAGENMVVVRLTGVCGDLVCYSAEVLAQPGAALEEEGVGEIPEPIRHVEYDRARNTDPAARARYLVPLGAYKAFLAQNRPGDAAAWAGEGYFLRKVESSEARAGGIPVVLTAFQGNLGKEITFDTDSDGDLAATRIVECPADNQENFLRENALGDAAPWAGENAVLIGVSSQVLSSTMLAFTLRARAIRSGQYGPASYRNAGDGTQIASCRWRCRPAEYAALSVRFQPGAAADWAESGYVVRSLQTTVRSRFELELHIEAERVWDGPVGALEISSASDGTVTESQSYRYTAEEGSVFAASYTVGSAAPWNANRRITAVRSVSGEGGRMRVTLSAQDFSLRPLAPVSRALDADNFILSRITYLVPLEGLDAFLAGRGVGSPAEWAGEDAYGTAVSISPHGVSAYAVKLEARSFRTGMIDSSRSEHFAGYDDDGFMQREINFTSRWQVKKEDLPNFLGLTGSSASWTEEASLVVDVEPKRLSDFAYEVLVKAESVRNPNLFRRYSGDNRSNLGGRSDYAAALVDFWLSAEHCGYRRGQDGAWEEIPDWEAATDSPFLAERLAENFANSLFKTVEVTETTHIIGGLKRNLNALVSWGRSRVFDGRVGTCSGSFLKTGMSSGEIYDNSGNRWTRVVYRYQLSPPELPWNPVYWANH